MVKMENPSRKGMVKSFKESAVKSAEKLGWKKVGKVYNSRTNKTKKTKK
tara:strand:+ start:1599 stop:1745 length:147 start_codon:yes stop_codon:yes gene_type:complete